MSKTMTESQASKPRHLIFERKMPVSNWVKYLLWNLGLMLLACGVLTYYTLRFSYSNLDPLIHSGYYSNLWIPFFNLLIVFSLCVFLFTLTGRAWLGFLLTAVICLGIALGNYYLIILRTDPLRFQDLSCLREALAITDTQEYELKLTNQILDSIGVSISCSIMLALLSRWRPRFSFYYFVWLVGAGATFFGSLYLTTLPRINELTKNYEHINTWSVTEIYVSRGIIYSFSQSIFTSSGKPADYSEEESASLLEGYSQENLPKDRKVDLFVIMRESYADLSQCNTSSSALDFSCYNTYHRIVNEAVTTGTLVTNGFGGNTKDAERCFLTGSYKPLDWRQPANSYVWYLKGQGYRTEGAHPFNGWFYNRQNINRYLGFDHYKFREDTFDALVGTDSIANDAVLFDEIWRMYEASDPSMPYFNFSVTYEGHGPYNYSKNLYHSHYVQEAATSPDGYAMNNYLGCAAHRDEELELLLARFRSSNRPIVLLLYGDHKATLGKDINNYSTSAYERYGINMNLKNTEGFLNYYSTDYVIWMNEAAKNKLAVSDRLQIGPTISPCYLMNVLFNTLGWGKGPEYLQVMDDMMEAFPICSTKGLVSVNGKLSATIPENQKKQFDQFQSLNYYWNTQFRYDALAKTLQTS